MDFYTRLLHDFPTVLENFYDLECPPGWELHVRELLTQLEKHARANNKHLRVAQIKPKFGGLRCYVSNSDEKADALVREAEHVSFTLCEVCGRPGKLAVIGGYWMETLCPVHVASSSPGASVKPH